MYTPRTPAAALATLLLAAAACSTTPLVPGPTLELTDSIYYTLSLYTEAALWPSDSTLFEADIEEYGYSTPLANTIQGQSLDGASGIASGAVEPLEITTGSEVRSGNHRAIDVEGWSEASMSVVRCGYPAGTPYRVVATFAPATGVSGTGDFAGSYGDGEFEINVGVRTRTDGQYTWATGGETWAVKAEETSYEWSWEERGVASYYGSVAYPTTDFFQGYTGADATVVSPDMVVGADGCVEVQATLDTTADLWADAARPLVVSGSYSLSVMIET